MATPLPTNRAKGQTISAEDINAIAALVNSLVAASGQSSGGTPATKSWVSPLKTKPATGFLRTVNVSTKAQLDAAMTDLRYGDNVILAPGTYTYTADLVITTPAVGTYTASAPPPPTWISGPRTAIISRTGTSTGYAIHCDNMNFVVLDGFTVQGGQKSCIGDQCNDNQIQNMDLGKSGMELLHFRNFSNRNVFVKNYIHHSDVDGGDGGTGEGMYIGQASSNWSASYSRTAGAIDVCNDNWFYENTVEACLSECLDVKEGTSRTVIRGNTMSGNRISGLNSADSYVDIKGNDCIVEDNTCSNPSSSVTDALQTHILYAGYGNRNKFRRNTLAVGSSSAVGINVQVTGSRGDAVGNIVYSDNVQTGGSGLSNIPVTPA